MAVTAPKGFTPGDAGATARTWGFQDGRPCHQYIGSVALRPGLVVAFPNIYQHRHTSFCLTDPSKEGHHTSISFFLVDPDLPPILSTSDVAPQQFEWIKTAVDESLDSRVPNEVVELIMECVEGLMTDEEAKNIREKMLAERAALLECNDSHYFGVPFDIWNTIS
jgi:hypothetical protein